MNRFTHQYGERDGRVIDARTRSKSTRDANFRCIGEGRRQVVAEFPAYAAVALARLIGPYDVTPVEVRADGRAVPGYGAEYLADAWTRYLTTGRGHRITGAAAMTAAGFRRFRRFPEPHRAPGTCCTPADLPGSGLLANSHASAAQPSDSHRRH
jgi:hypothetical protein